MTITATIMAHPKRKAEAEALFRSLTNMHLFIEVSITWDEQNDEWHTGKRALAAGHGDWHLVLQDDAILTPKFADNLLGVISAVPAKTLISLYTGKPRPLGNRVEYAVNAAADGTFLRFHQLLWGVGIVIPTAHIAEMLEFVEGIQLNYDNKIGEFYCRQGLPVYYSMPSLVDHDDDIGSLLGHGVDKPPRVAHRLAKAVINWSSKERYI